MQKLVKFMLLVTFALLSSNAVAGRTAPLVNVENIAVVSGSGNKLSVEQVKQAVIRAATVAQWSVTPPAAGTIVATLQVRGKHTLMVDIPYSAESFSVRYKDSVNLNHGMEELEQTNYKPVEVVHPNVNKWMMLLKDAIRAELARL